VAEEKEFEEGWYTDPYGRHEARWMSAGQPTKLVRDAGVESYDAPPDEDSSVAAERIVPEPPPGADVVRSGDQEDEVQTTQFDAAVFGAVAAWEPTDRKNRH